MNNLRSKFKLPFFITIFSLIVFSISCSLEETTDDTSEVEEEIVIVEDQGPLKMYLLHNNDGESELLGDDEEGYFGIARFANILKEQREEASNNDYFSMLVSSGDNILAGANFSSRKSFDKMFDAVALNYLDYDAIGLGNHDFDFGPDITADIIEQSEDITFLAANLDFTGEPRLASLESQGRIAPAKVINLGNHQVGIISAVTNVLPRISSPRNVIVNTDVAASIQFQIDEMEKKGINHIIVLSHMQSINEDIEIIDQLSGVDVYVAGGGSEILANSGDELAPGDDEDVWGTYPMYYKDSTGKDIPLVTTSDEYNYLGKLIVHFNEDGEVEKIDEKSGPVVVKGDKDKQLESAIEEPLKKYLENLANNQIAVSEVSLNAEKSTIRTTETGQGRLQADSLLWQASRLAHVFGAPAPDVGLQNGGGIRNNNIIPPGPITEQMTYDMSPFTNYVVIIPNLSATVFKEVLENAYSNIENVDGRFAQLSGVTVVIDSDGKARELDPDGNIISEGSRVVDVKLKDGTWLVRNGVVLENAPNINVATIDFLANGGDDYPWEGREYIKLGVSYQEALFNYITDGLNNLIDSNKYGNTIQNVILDDLDYFASTKLNVDIKHISTFETGVYDESAAEIVAYDNITSRLFSINAMDGSCDVYDMSKPSKLVLENQISYSYLGMEINSVDVHNGIMALAIQAEDETKDGMVAFYDTSTLSELNTVKVGALPDAVKFSPDGNFVVVSNEGQPNDDYSVDPVGSISVINMKGGVKAAHLNTTKLVPNEVEEGVRIFGKGANISEDLEPEYATISPDSKTAYVVAQENNAMIVVDLETATITNVYSLGYKDHLLPGNGFDASNKDGKIFITNWPTHGAYQPDMLSSFEVNGNTFIVSANEGDARDYDGYSEEVRVADLKLDPEHYPMGSILQLEENLGRLKTTTATGDHDGDGDIDQIMSYGARSFSIWDSSGNLIFDSGSALERMTAWVYPNGFNNDEGEFDGRSDDKGPEPEAATIGHKDGRIYAFIGLERTGGFVIYDVTNPVSPDFIDYIYTKGDIGPEGIEFIPEDANGNSLIVVGNEVSGSISVYRMR